MGTSITYKDAGVDIDIGDELVERIKPLAKKTIRDGVLAGIGGFGAMFEISKKYQNPVLVSGTDGVGTKLKLAFELNRHDTIGIDLVAMSVNDILVQGAEPLFFLDYFACGKLDINVATNVIKGIANGCSESGCSLIGGETAEMPGMYPEGEYDLAGFAVGVVEKSNIIDGKCIGVGDVILGLESSGFHSNGYSLVRKIIKLSKLDLDSKYDENNSWADAIMAPTKLYVQAILALLKITQSNAQEQAYNKVDLHDMNSKVNNCNKSSIHGMSHITGGGITGNLPRIFPKHLAAQIELSALPKIKLFEWIKDTANLDQMQMLETFNCGIGYVVIVPRDNVAEISKLLLDNFKIKTYNLGHVVQRVDKEIIYV